MLAPAARADAADTLRAFVREVQSGRASFTQTVTATDGARQKISSGSFEFQRPNRFRFNYTAPFVQSIVADGQKVWIYDPDLNQASSRKLGAAIGATPAALLAGASLDADFVLLAEAAVVGNAADAGAGVATQPLQWVRATPKAGDGTFQWMRVGFQGRTLAAVEILDSLGQRSVLRFTGFAPNIALPPETFRFVPPAGADVIEQ